MKGRLPLVPRWQIAIADSGLPKTAKLVAWALSTYMNPSGYTYVSKLNIAGAAGLSVRHKGNTAVDVALDRLEREGFLRIVRNRGRVGWEFWAVIPRAYEGASGRKSHVDRPRNPTPRGGEIPRVGVGELRTQNSGDARTLQERVASLEGQPRELPAEAQRYLRVLKGEEAA